MSKIWKSIEYGFTVLSLVIYSGGILTVILSGGISEGDEGFTQGTDNDNSLIKIVFLIIYLITFLLLVARWKKVIYTLKKDKYILLLLCSAIASILWSYNSQITLSRSIAIFGTILFGLYLASRYTLQQQVLLLVWTFGTIIILSLVFIVVLPKYGIMGGVHRGAWRGIYNHKNVFGKMMVVSAIVFLLQSVNYSKNKLKIYLGLSLSILFLLMSRSSSSVLNLLIVTVLLIICHTWRWRYEIMIPVSIGTIMISSISYLLFDTYAPILFGAFGKDASLSGRSDLWILVWDMIQKQPWFGYGYGAFWDGFNGPSAVIWTVATWKPPNAHNGFLDLLLSLGLLGIIIFIFSFLQTLPNAMIWVRYSHSSDGFWPLLFMVYLILSNLTESSLMLQNDLFSVLYIAIAYTVLTPPNKSLIVKG